MPLEAFLLFRKLEEHFQTFLQLLSDQDPSAGGFMQRLMPTGLLTGLALNPDQAGPSGTSPAEPSTISEGSDGSSEHAPADPPGAEPTGEAGTSALRAPVLSYPASQAVHHPTLPGLGTRTEDWQKDRKIEKSIPDKLDLDDPMQV